MLKIDSNFIVHECRECGNNYITPFCLRSQKFCSDPCKNKGLTDPKVALTPEGLHELLIYRPLTGEFLKRDKLSSKILPTGVPNIKHGYLMVMVNGKSINAAKLAWIMMTGKAPPRGTEIDHINRNKKDCRWENLRLATRSENLQNQAVTVRNKSGYKGVSFNKLSNSWTVNISKEHFALTFRNFKDKHEAALVYNILARKYHGDFAVLNEIPEGTKTSRMLEPNDYVYNKEP